MRQSVFFAIILIVLVLVGLGVLATKRQKTNDFSNNAGLYVGEPTMNTDFKITSKAFDEGGFIPKKYTCDGENIIPPLSISGVPENTKSLVLIIDDPDALAGTWNHLLMWNINPETIEIKEGTYPESAILGKNDFGELGYGGPCPPSGIHRYFFRLFALDSRLYLPEGVKRNELDQAIKGHVIASTTLVGKYSRTN